MSRIPMLALMLAAVVAGLGSAHAQAPSVRGAARGQTAPSFSPPAACSLETVAAGAVARVSDGVNFVLADGREVRLAGLAPLPESPGETEQVAADATGTRLPTPQAALASLLAGQEVVLRRAAEASDRYGRLLALVYVVRDGAERLAQRELLARGDAVLAPGLELACPAERAELSAAERAARKARLGVWADPDYFVRRADNPAAILAHKGRFTLVQGKVLSVRESGGTIFVNFGRRWSEDFTVTISKRNERMFVSAGLAPKALAGRRVEVRGFIEERGGPWIEATRPEQITMVEAP
jgi:endonuclease YncB( thermonuclease family)